MTSLILGAAQNSMKAPEMGLDSVLKSQFPAQ
jgi:hypothetical protein